MKKIKLLILSLVMFFTGSIICYAATLNVTAYLSTSQAVVGNTVTFSVKLSSSTPIGAVNYSVTYDSSKLTHVSGTLNDITDNYYGKTSYTLTFKFRAKAKGNANITFKVNEAYDTNLKPLSFSNKTKTLNIITQAQLEGSYSKNNNLSKLGVDGYKISPAFNKNTVNYSLELENNIRSINVTGAVEDSKSSVSGLGKHSLVEGVNKINIKVTAQNGSSKTYTLNVTVKELKPIVVEKDGQTFNVVRKKELIKNPNSNFVESTIKIDQEDVPAFVNEKTNTTLVGLKDASGNIALYSYNNGNYSPYKDFNFDSLIVTITNTNDIPEGYQETKIKIDEEEVTAYKAQGINDGFYLINAVNISTGEEHLYQYDEKERTIQRFNTKPIDKINELNIKNNKSLYVIIGLGGLLIITYLVLLVSTIRNKKRKKNKCIAFPNRCDEELAKKNKIYDVEETKDLDDLSGKLKEEENEDLVESEKEDEENNEKIELLDEKEDIENDLNIEENAINNKESDKKKKKDGKIKGDISKIQKRKNK